MRLKKFIAILLVIIIVPGVIFGVSYAEQALRDKTTLGRTQTRYDTDDSGNRIANIPYDEYAGDTALPEDAVTVTNLSESAGAEHNAAEIQAVIDSLSANGGGVVRIPPGRYQINTIYLKNDITLFIPQGAELVAPCCEENLAAEHPLDTGVICAENASNISIIGGGTVHGMGETYTNEPEEKTPLYALKKFNTYTRVIEARKRIRMGKNVARPNVIYLNACRNINIDGIVLKDSASWTFVLEQCSDVNITNLVIDNHMHVANSDGIDIVGGENININHSFIATGDDGIVLKPRDAEIRNVDIRDCIVSSYANCFKIGTETQMDVENVNVTGCYFFLPNGITGGYSGIAVESCDGSNISDVTISDITMEGISSPLLIWLGNRLQYEKKQTGSLNGVTIQNVTAADTELPSAITGCMDGSGATHYVQNVVLKDISVSYRDTGEDLHIRKKIGEFSMRDYPDITRVSHIYFIDHQFSKYWDIPCYGLVVRHAENITYDGYFVTPRTCNTRDKYYIDDVR